MRTLLFAFVLIGCGSPPHLNIPAPPPQVTPEQRVEAFKTYRQGGSAVEIVTSCQRGACSTSRTDMLVLGDGTLVRYAEDVLPLLPDNSDAAAAARDAAAARRRHTRWKRIGYAGGLGGFAIMLAGFGRNGDVFVLGLGTMIVGSFVGIGGMIVNTSEINRKTKIVFANYDQNLATRLNVCVNGLAVVACEQSVPGLAPPPPEEPDPALRSLRQK